MKFIAAISLILLIKSLDSKQNVSANEVLGCGGFIKSHADIDFSKVEIKLLTKHGSLKDKTDCSPSNGYYFLPIYDKGEYLLKIAPPPGWSFEPEQIELHFNGKDDICSQGKDVNFAFKGFGITGKVQMAGTKGNSGARNVIVELKSVNGDDVRSTHTDANGVYSFSPVIPGKYVLRASVPHARWFFSSSEVEVVVTSGNTELPENSLLIAGFEVSGRFEHEGQLTAGLAVALFREKGQTLPVHCANRLSPVPLNVAAAAAAGKYEDNSVCYALVDKAGDYTFKGVPPGKYLLQPVIENANLQLHLNAEYIEFEVSKDALQLSAEFKITGFSVSGQVLTSAQGSALAGATVKLNGKVIAQTDQNGAYTLSKLKAGTYTLHFEAPKLQFNEQQVKLQLPTPNIPVAVPSAYEVCGKVVSKKSYVVGITKHAATFHTTTASKAETGDWCAYLPSGKFTLEVITTEADKASGIQFYPVQQQIEVIAAALSGITFSQLRATLNGEIKCLQDAPKACTAAEVTLHGIDANGHLNGIKHTTIAQNGKYSFKDVLPGPYEVTIPQSACFESTRVFLNIDSAVATAPQFVQRGYEVTIVSSHRAIMKYTFITAGDQPTAATETLKLPAGVNTFCVTRYGSYNFKLEGCHLYAADVPKTFTTINPQPLSINAYAHKVGVRILYSEATGEAMQLLLESDALGKQTITPTQEALKVDGKYAYRHDTYLKPQEVLRITPKSDVLLFTPASAEIVGSNDCVDVAYTFVAARGLILRGKVLPAIKDARITLSFPQNVDLAQQTELTNANGEFKFGPIDESLQYELKAEKESYVFAEYNRAAASFSAHKLCEIVVKVKDEQGKELSGVLLSLSGGASYRKNLVTSADEAINFHSLSPSQYFLRPMMKEYKFEPNSKIIDIKDGETVVVELVGKRVAYSIFGSISSLNGEPFAQINVEAIADEACAAHQEEATSESNGQYRIRGLQPGCKYTVRLKESSTANGVNVERSIPASRTVQIAQEDVRGINLIAITSVNYVDVKARVTALLNEHYKTLRIVLYRKGASDSPLYSQRLETPLNLKARYNPGIMVFFPRIPLDGKTYVVELRSALSDKTYSYSTPMESFVANTSSVFIELDFKPEVRTAETDLNQNSISALILVALVAIAFFKQDLAMDALNFVWSRASSAAENIMQQQRANSKKDARETKPLSQKEIEQMADQINAVKKKKAKKIN